MYTFLVILIILICLLLAGIVLIQAPKGGGLDSTFGGISTNTFGAQRTTDFLEKGTWYLAIALLLVSLGSSLYVRSQGETAKVRTEGVNPDLPEAQPENTVPLLPSQTPDPDENGGE